MKKIGFISLGCSKNLVDTEMMIGLMEKAGYEMTEDLNEANVIIINTCTFIDAAKDESVQTLLQATEYKKNGKCEKLSVPAVPGRTGQRDPGTGRTARY